MRGGNETARVENATAHVRRVTLLNTTRTRAASRPIRWHDGSRRLWLHGHTYRRYHPAQHPFTGAWIRCSASFAHVPQRCVLAAPAPALIRGGHSLRGCAACVSAQLGEQRLRPLPDARQRQTASRQREQDELVAHCQRVFEHRDRLQSLLVHLQRGPVQGRLSVDARTRPSMSARASDPDPSTGAISAALQPPAASGGPRRDDPTGKRVEYDSSKTITSGHGGLNRKFLEILIRDDKIRTSRVAAARDWTETKVGRREEANIWVSTI